MAPVHPVKIPLPLPLTSTHDTNDKTKLRRRRSSTFTAIANWALAVQPGSPAPISPNRRLPSHRRVPSNAPSFLHIIDTPTSASRFPLSPHSAKEFPGSVDLTNWGYTSIFLRLPVTPSTPSQFRRRSPVIPEASMKPEKGIKKIKSLGILRRNRAKSVADDVSPTSPTPRSHTRSRSRPRSGSVTSTKSVSSKRSAVYPKSKSKSKPKTANHPPLPPALQTELLLMQFTGGGSLEANAQRLMEQRAKSNTDKAVGTVYKDENGVMWLDEDERAEYEALIPPSSTPSSPASPWVQFSSTSLLSPMSPAIGAFMAARAGSVRRGSVKSLTPTERELEAAMAVRPISPSAYIGVNLINTSVISKAETNERRRKRPAPLKLHSAPVVPTASAAQGFEDSFEPTSAELVVMAAGMHIYARAAKASRFRVRRGGEMQVQAGSAPADATDFGVTIAVADVVPKEEDNPRRKKMNLAKRARALFGKE
ncbi:hypothetical protein E1B28_007873 [Marasmius oreades]|uniref:Uncharacterized protein n=1 Tax=Marasmius oreades TaxID=181124 RepID=A0A9P7S2G0_9AGAR|nr:uncharacterized protein E1B28_007873 [Marasmius oreades]KAG7094269.1 hypothetical protein E1B28_007873 [Marasmius oreades]